MEKRLEDFIMAVAVASDIENLGDEAPQVLYKNNPATSKTSTFVVSKTEPSTMILPLNVIWIDWNPTSATYRHAYKRISKDPSTQFDHTWQLLYYYEEVWDDQFYDADDLLAIGNGSAPNAATTTDLGIVRLATEWTGQGHPQVLTEGDPRLSDDRDPLPHTHPEKPAKTLAHAQGGVVNISQSNAPVVGATLVADSNSAASWRKLQEQDLS